METDKEMELHHHDHHQVPDVASVNNNLSILPVPDFSCFASKRFSKKRQRRSISEPQMPETPRKTRNNYLTPASPLSLPIQFQVSPITPKLSQNEAENYFQKSFDQITEIGKGSFSNVYKARHIATNKFYAIKVSKREIFSARQLNKAIKEIKAVQKLSHSHVLKYVFSWIQNRKLHIQTELYEQGTLQHYIQNRITKHSTENGEKYLKEKVIWNFLVDLLLGIYHIHSSHLLHLDIKPANIFVDANHHLVIGDFGLLKRKKKKKIIEELEDETVCDDDDEDGDAQYLAPEVIQGKVTEYADIFSLGITLFELATLYIEIPSDGDNWELLRAGNITSHKEFPTHYSEDLKEVIERMVKPKYPERPMAGDLLKHRRVVAIIMERMKIFSDDSEYMSGIPPFLESNKRVKYPSLPCAIKLDRNDDDDDDEGDDDGDDSEEDVNLCFKVEPVKSAGASPCIHPILQSPKPASPNPEILTPNRANCQRKLF